MAFRRPTNKAHIWVHVDEFNKRNKRTWAVQYYDTSKGGWRYYTTRRVIAKGALAVYTVFDDGKEPKAVALYPSAELGHRSPLLVILQPFRTLPTLTSED